MLESPTGTGKTLCLLCAALAWRDNYVKLLAQTQQSRGVRNETALQNVAFDENRGIKSTDVDVPKIIYATRTHTQIAQTIAELKRTAYKPQVCVLGSREQMCINHEVGAQKIC